MRARFIRFKPPPVIIVYQVLVYSRYLVDYYAVIFGAIRGTSRSFFNYTILRAYAPRTQLTVGMICAHTRRVRRAKYLVFRQQNKKKAGDPLLPCSLLAHSHRRGALTCVAQQLEPMSQRLLRFSVFVSARDESEEVLVVLVHPSTVQSSGLAAKGRNTRTRLFTRRTLYLICTLNKK